jgi:hypothetical protein
LGNIQKRRFFKINIKYHLVLLSVPFSMFVHAQSIKGYIKNIKGIPLEFATITFLKHQDSTFFETIITDSVGFYNSSIIENGYYNLKISFTNYETQTADLFIRNDTIVNFQLTPRQQQLQEVIVTSKKPLIERKVDRIIFNVENSVTAIGSDALEALSKTPSVRVQNNKISLIGKSGVNIMIDGKLSPLSGDDLANYLKSISADNIVRVEVIITPPAQYDAQGNNGLINIVLKGNQRLGYNGDIRMSYIQTTYATAIAGGDFNYNKNKFKFYSNLNLGDGSIAPIEQQTIFYSNQTWEQTDYRIDFQKYLSGTCGLDYDLSKHTSFGIIYNGGISYPDMNEHISIPIYNNTSGLDSSIKTNAYTDRSINRNAINIHLKQQIDTIGKQLLIDADYFSYKDNNQRTFNTTNYSENGLTIPNSYVQDLSNSNQNIDLYTLKVDLNLPFKKYTLALGGKLSFIKNLSDISFSESINNQYTIDSAQSNTFHYVENTQAFYSNISKTIKKWDFQGGLRFELTQTKGYSVTNNQTNTNNYLKYFPTVFINYNMDDKNIFSLSYGKRINRPSYSWLNPFRWYTDPYAYSEGNPFLQPSYNNNIELSYTYNNFLTTGLSFSKETNKFDQIVFVQNNSNIQINEPLNFITGYSYIWSNSVSFEKLKWLENNSQFSLYYMQSNSSIPQTQQSVEGWGAYMSIDNQFIFNQKRTIICAVNFWYQFPAVDGVDKSSAYYNIDAGLKFLLKKGKIQIAVNTVDIFKTNKPVYYSLVNNIKQQYNNYYDTRQFKLSVRYSFGNAKIKKEDHQLGNQEERDRVN